MKIRFGRVLVGILTVLFCLNVNQAFGTTVYGEIYVERDGHETLRFPFQAALDAKQQQWQVKVTYGENNATKYTYQEICGSDGEKTCCIEKDSKERLVRDIGAAGATEVPPRAYIVDGTFPGLSINSSTKVVWLAFGSAPFFRESTNNPLPSLNCYSFNQLESYGKKTDKMEFLEPAGRLPSKIDFVYSTNQLLQATNFPFVQKSLQSQRHIGEVARDIQEYLEGALDAQYTVIDTTNYDGMVLPLTFKCEFFTIGPGKKLFPRETFVGKVSRVTSETPGSFLPDIIERLWTRDYRFSDNHMKIDNISYFFTNRLWPSTNDAALRDIFQRKISNLPPLADETKPSVGPKTWLVRILMLLAISAFPVIILLNKILNKKP
jgi:hypothetical protein